MTVTSLWFNELQTEIMKNMKPYSQKTVQPKQKKNDRDEREIQKETFATHLWHIFIQQTIGLDFFNVMNV